MRTRVPSENAPSRGGSGWRSAMCASNIAASGGSSMITIAAVSSAVNQPSSGGRSPSGGRAPSVVNGRTFVPVPMLSTR